MSLKVCERFALANISELTTPTSTQSPNYRLGEVVKFYNSDLKAEQHYQYVKAHDALTQYQPYVITISAVSGAEITTGAIPAGGLAAPGCKICVPQVAFTSGYYGFVLVEGDGSGLIGTETYAVGDMLTINDSTTTFVVDGTSGATTYSVYTFAVSKSAGTDAAAISIYLKNRQAVIAHI